MTVIDYHAKKQAKAHAQACLALNDLINQLEVAYQLAEDWPAVGDLLREALKHVRDEECLQAKYDAAMREKREREAAS